MNEKAQTVMLELVSASVAIRYLVFEALAASVNYTGIDQEKAKLSVDRWLAAQKSINKAIDILKSSE